MTSNFKCYSNTQNHQQHSPRATQLNIFYSLKANHLFISRHQLYLAIAILDKYLLKCPQNQQKETITHRTMEIRAVAALFIACKFSQTHHFSLSELSMNMCDGCSLKEQIIEMQGEILSGIDFQVPIDFTYAAMTRAFKTARKESSDEKTIVSKCLAFLKQALHFSNNFSLVPQLGTQVVDLILLRTSKDHRIKQICQCIINQGNRQTNKQNILNEQILSK